MHDDAIRLTTRGATIRIQPQHVRHLRAMVLDQVAGDTELLREIDQGEAPGFCREEIAGRLAFARTLGLQVAALDVVAVARED
jgi:hypothetical protein